VKLPAPSISEASQYSFGIEFNAEKNRIMLYPLFFHKYSTTSMKKEFDEFIQSTGVMFKNPRILFIIPVSLKII